MMEPLTNVGGNDPKYIRFTWRELAILLLTGAVGLVIGWTKITSTAVAALTINDRLQDSAIVQGQKDDAAMNQWLLRIETKLDDVLKMKYGYVPDRYNES